MDTGNLIYSGVAISDKMAQHLKLPILPDNWNCKMRFSTESTGESSRNENQSSWGWQLCGQPPSNQRSQYPDQLRYCIFLRMDRKDATVQIEPLLS